MKTPQEEALKLCKQAYRAYTKEEAEEHSTFTLIAWKIGQQAQEAKEVRLQRRLDKMLSTRK